jgi:hypothetical protein
MWLLDANLDVHLVELLKKTFGLTATQLRIAAGRHSAMARLSRPRLRPDLTLS